MSSEQGGRDVIAGQSNTAISFSSPPGRFSIGKLAQLSNSCVLSSNAVRYRKITYLSSAFIPVL